MDALDNSLLEALRRDGRTPFTDLARRLGVSEGTVRGRVSRLEESGVLRIVALCNPLTLGHQPARLLIAVRDLTPRSVAKALCDVPSVNHVALCAGTQDVYVEVTCRDLDQLVTTLDEVRMLPGVARIEPLLLMRLYKDYSWDGLAESRGRAVGQSDGPEASAPNAVSGPSVPRP